MKLVEGKQVHYCRLSTDRVLYLKICWKTVEIQAGFSKNSFMQVIQQRVYKSPEIAQREALAMQHPCIQIKIGSTWKYEAHIRGIGKVFRAPGNYLPGNLHGTGSNLHSNAITGK
jgi:hypothetical protein